jgi:multidrug transporter EmrE-like cation transporter
LLAAVLLLSYLIAIRQMPISVAYLAVTSVAMIGLVAVDSIFSDLG